MLAQKENPALGRGFRCYNWATASLRFRRHELLGHGLNAVGANFHLLTVNSTSL